VVVAEVDILDLLNQGQLAVAVEVLDTVALAVPVQQVKVMLEQVLQIELEMEQVVEQALRQWLALAPKLTAQVKAT
jgi:hypothetical protein